MSKAKRFIVGFLGSLLKKALQNYTNNLFSILGDMNVALQFLNPVGWSQFLTSTIIQKDIRQLEQQLAVLFQGQIK